MKSADEHATGHHPATKRRKKRGPLPYLATVMLNRWTVTIFNAITCLVCTIAMIDVIGTIVAHSDQHAAEEIVTGIGVILIGYGVVMEERHSFRRLMGGVLGTTEAWETAIDDLCHGSGLLLLVFGLLAEVGVTCLDLPDHIVNTHGIERWVLSVSVAFIIASMATMVFHSLRMIALREPIETED